MKRKTKRYFFPGERKKRRRIIAQGEWQMSTTRQVLEHFLRSGGVPDADKLPMDGFP